MTKVAADSVPEHVVKAVGEAEKRVATSIEQPEAKRRKIQKRKYAMILAYQGKNYFGMQIQPPAANQPTIESHLLQAMGACNLIDNEMQIKPILFQFQRAARTDRKVSAVRQFVSFFLPLEDEFVKNAPKELNKHLPDDIRVMALRRTIPSFHAQKRCDSRTYSYTLPTFAFAPVTELTTPAYRMDEQRLKEVNEVLSCFNGTHNFFNYTSKKEHGDQSCNRYIISFKCSDPFVHTYDFGFKKTEFEFATIYIQGQSFMLHQIRKMIGMTLTILRGMQNKSDITRSFESLRMDVPRVPGLGLILERVHYGNYDKTYQNIHASLDNLGEEVEEEIKTIRSKLIIDEILTTEATTNSMMMWLADLVKHDFCMDPESETNERKSDLCLARNAAAAALEAAGVSVDSKKEDEEEGEEIEDAQETEPQEDGEFRADEEVVEEKKVAAM